LPRIATQRRTHVALAIDFVDNFLPKHSLRNGLTTYSVLSLVIGFLATIVPEKPASQELDASTEASGPHAFVVRVSTPRQRRLCVHRNPSLVRDDGQRPSSRDGMATDLPRICLLEKRNIFDFGT